MRVVRGPFWDDPETCGVRETRGLELPSPLKISPFTQGTADLGVSASFTAMYRWYSIRSIIVVQFAFLCCMAGLHSWEVPSSASSRRSWEDVPEFQDCLSEVSTDDSDQSELDPEEACTTDPSLAAEMLLDYMLDLYYDDKLTAKAICVISFWGTHAGIKPDIIKNVALRPSAPSGHFQRKLDTLLDMKIKPGEMLTTPVPGHRKYDASRSLFDMPMQAPHEIVEAELAKEPTLLSDIAEKVKNTEWCDAYMNHPVVKECRAIGKPVVPLCLYVDGVPFVKKDGVIGFKVYPLLSGRRYLVAALRRSELCRCGCKGWCTIVQVWQFLRWSLEACRAAVWPTSDSNGAPWSVADGVHYAKQGTPLGAASAIIHSKGDWSEYAHTYGFLPWSHKLHPCLFCWCDRSTLYKVEGLSPFETPHRLVQQHEYDAACSACEVWAIITSMAGLMVILGALRFDKRKTGGGRILECDLPEFGLLANDRLEPHPGLWDVGAFDARIKLPARVLFWRSSRNTITKHRCPLFSSTLGITIMSLVIDILHALNLGVYQQYCADMLWAIVRADCFRVGPTKAMDERLQLSAMRIRSALFSWYTSQATSHPDDHIHELQDFTAEMMGTSTKQKLRLKAAETKSFLFFTVDLAKRFESQLPQGPLLVSAGTCLTTIQRAFDENGEKMRPASVQDVYAC
jgi:hypothetical protein